MTLPQTLKPQQSRTYESDELDPELRDIKLAIQELKAKTGFGVVTIVFKAGVLDEIEVRYSRKPKVERKGQ